MKTVKYLPMICVIVSFMGCPARSLFPLFADKEIVFNPAIVGAWIDKNEKATYLFQKGDGKSYSVIVCRESGDTSHYGAQLGKLGKDWFLDSYPNQDPNDFQLVPTRIISKIRFSGDSLTFVSLEGEYLEKMIEAKTLSIPYTLHKGNVVLTASTKELQQLIVRVSRDDAAFPNPTTLIRMKE